MAPTINQQQTLEQALVYAIRLLDNMERHSYGGVLLVPDVFIWTVEQFNPELIATLRKEQLLSVFKKRLEQYYELRRIADSLRLEELVECEADTNRVMPDPGPLELYDIKHALSIGNWQSNDVSAHGFFRRVIHAAQEDSDFRETLDQQLDRLREAYATTYYARASISTGHADGQADQLDPMVPEPLASALVHARRQLLACDNGTDWRMWEKFYTSVLGDWLEDDQPELAANVLIAGQVDAYVNDITLYSLAMRKVEGVWHTLSPHVRLLLLCQTDAECPISLIAKVIRAQGIAENEVHAWASRAWEMVKRRAVPAHERHVNEALVSQDTSTVIERIRSDNLAHSTCFIVDRHCLPEPLHSMTDERQCLAIRLPEDRRQFIDQLVFGSGVSGSTSMRNIGESAVASSQLSVNDAFCCDWYHLWDILFRFRRAIPVLHVFDAQCILIIYPFSHYGHLRALLDRESDVSPAECGISKRPEGTPLEPTVVEQVVDISGLSYGKVLRESYYAAHPSVVRLR